ncbi:MULTISPECIES: hypothetical protein [unclassified Streptomyces]|uniref:hypothetical protein n=1 Tax=unclassified Streptomyces TaxID=2593676 RepID=UPI0036F024A4
MTTEDPGALAVPDPSMGDHQGDDFFASEAHRIAARWGQLPPEHFKLAVQAARAEGALRSQERVLQMRLVHEVQMERVAADKAAAEAAALAEQQTAQHQAESQAERLRHRRHVIDVAAGLTICGALIVVAVLVVDRAAWLSAVLCGPSLLALAKVFILRRSDPGDLRVLGKASAPPPP